jgi:chemotaxis protein MotB
MKTSTIRAGALPVLPVLALLALGAAGCGVSKDKYDMALAQTETTRAQLGKANSDLGRTQAELAKTNEDLETARAATKRLEALMNDAMQTANRDQKTSTARIDELRRRIDELRVAQAAAERRAALFQDLAHRLKAQVDAGDVMISVRDGRIILQLPNDVLFDTGRTELKPAGTKALDAIAGVLASMPNRHFQVAGHTDDVPIHNAMFASNWELSSGRALRVVHYLIGKGAHPPTLSAAGYAEMDPLAPNTSADTRKRNRRTEITVMPNIDETVAVP